MPQRKPRTPLSQARADLREALASAHQGNFESAIKLCCRTYRLPSERRLDQHIRIWDRQVMQTPERFFEWLEAVQMACRDSGVVSSGYSSCLKDAILYWHKTNPKHAYWAERWRQLAELPELELWAEEIDRTMRLHTLKTDPFQAIA